MMSSYTYSLILKTILMVFLLEARPTSSANPVALHGLNYNTRKGPDWDPDRCKQSYEILNDLTLLSRMTKRFRLLSLTDCNQGAMVLEVAQQLDLTLWLGLWVGLPPENADEESAFEKDFKELQRLIEEEPDVLRNHVIGVSVGSEALYREDATLADMIDNFNAVRNLLRNSGIDLPVTICDIAPEYAKSSILRDIVDVTMTNTFPFWEAIDVSVAVDDLQEDIGWLISQEESVNKPFVLGETGWPSDGFIEGVGIASPENQLIYFRDTYCRLRQNGWDYYWFTGIDNAWRNEQDPLNTIEEHWGFFYTNSTLKPHFVDFAFTCEDGTTFDFSLLDLSLGTNTASPTVTNLASCSIHPDCAGLLGDCCPGSDGVSLLCCDPTITAPISTPSAKPASPTKSPVSPTKSPASPTSTTEQPTSKPTKMPSQTSDETPSPATEDEDETPSPSEEEIATPSPSYDDEVPSNPTPKPTRLVVIDGADQANQDSAAMWTGGIIKSTPFAVTAIIGAWLLTQL